MGTRSDIIVHRADGKWHKIYCHWDGYLEHNGRILFNHYTSQAQVEALVALGNLSSLGPEIGRKHAFDGPKLGTKAYDAWQAMKSKMCTAYIRDRGLGDWHFAKTQAEFLAAEQGEIGDSLQAVWPEAETWTEFTYVWDEGKWWVTSPDEGTQTLVDLGAALLGKRKVKPAVKAFGMVIGQHGAASPGKGHTWSAAKGVFSK